MEEVIPYGCRRCTELLEENEKMRQALMRLAEDKFANTYTKSIISAALLTSESK